MRLSIITVNYNNREGLASTMRSVNEQTCKDFEYIVVDGASTDGSIDVIKQNQDFISKWVSEPDKGIYNAMNKAVKMATGDYCLFMNSGDTLFNPTTVEEIYKHKLEADFIEGIISLRSRGDRLHYPDKVINFSFYRYKTNNYHQASLIKRELLIKYPYDENYRISSDMKFNINAIVVHNCSYSTIDVVIASYEGGGRSVYVNHWDEREQLLKDLIPQRILNDYDDMEYLYQWPVVKFLPLLSRLGHSVSLLRFRMAIKKLLGKEVSKWEIHQLEKVIEWNLRLSQQ